MTQKGISRDEMIQRRDAERLFLRGRIARIDGLTEGERLELEERVLMAAKNPKECRKMGISPKRPYSGRISYNSQEETTRLGVILTQYIRTHEFRYR
jgi:hypothetical protein